MKKILILVLSIASLSSYSMSLKTAIEINDQATIKKALVIALKQKDLTCKTIMNRQVNWFEQTTKKDLIQYLNYYKTLIKISADSRQPLIETSYYRSSYINMVLFTTSEDFKEIVKVDISTDEIISKETNIGSLVEPIFKNEMILKRVVEEECY